jgi:hypothetical protein
MQSRNKNFMQTIFEVSIQQPIAGYLVNYHSGPFLGIFPWREGGHFLKRDLSVR